MRAGANRNSWLLAAGAFEAVSTVVFAALAVLSPAECSGWKELSPR